MPKRSLRSHLLAHRRALGHSEWLESSRLAQLNLLSLVEYHRAESIALYSPAHNETDTAIILTAAFEDNKRVLFPAVCGQNMVLRLVKKPDDLQEGAFGILEPKPSGVDHNVAIVDLVVVPGIAFDLTGHRIGYGKGYYDRFLQHPGRTTLLVGFCHDFQMVYNPLPADVHDVPMDVIVTDKRIIRLKK